MILDVVAGRADGLCYGHDRIGSQAVKQSRWLSVGSEKNPGRVLAYLDRYQVIT